MTTRQSTSISRRTLLGGLLGAGAIGTLAACGSSSSSSSATSAAAMEHLASFEPAYRITGLRDWLFQQSA